MIKMDEKLFDKSTKKDLKKYYEFIYQCSKCGKIYGCDEKDKEPYLCPVCEEKELENEKKK